MSVNAYDLPSIEPEFEKHAEEYLNDYIIAFTQNGEFVDHALHVKRISNTKIELGFHVADIAYFIKPGSSLDRKSKKRSSSVFSSKQSTCFQNKLTKSSLSRKMRKT